jgi:hypothetical protein
VAKQSRTLATHWIASSLRSSQRRAVEQKLRYLAAHPCRTGYFAALSGGTGPETHALSLQENSRRLAMLQSRFFHRRRDREDSVVVLSAFLVVALAIAGLLYAYSSPEKQIQASNLPSLVDVTQSQASQ